MNWFRQNRFLGLFLIVFAVATIAAAWFLWSANSAYEEARTAFENNASELNRLQGVTPFPTDPNLQKMKAQADDYAAQLEKLKEELKGRSLPVVAMQPNEFQSRLRQAMTAIAEKARANKVKLPENFFLGFDEFAASLPDTAAAPLLGQELAQVQLLLDILLDAHIDSLTSFRRVPPAAAPSPSPGARKPPAGTPAKTEIDRSTVEATFVAAPGAARRVLNQIATANQQFYLIRALHILNEKEKGPARDAVAATAAAAAPAAGATAASGLTFIVGNEHVEVGARIEMLRFEF